MSEMIFSKNVTANWNRMKQNRKIMSISNGFRLMVYTSINEIKWNKSHDLMIEQIFKRNEKKTWCFKNAASTSQKSASLSRHPLTQCGNIKKTYKRNTHDTHTHTQSTQVEYFFQVSFCYHFSICFAFFCLCPFLSLHFFILNILSSGSSFGFLCAVWHSLLAGRGRARCCVVINFVCTQEIAVAFYFDLLCTQHETITMPS